MNIIQRGELFKIRNEMLECAKADDMLGVKFQINKIDTLLYKSIQPQPTDTTIFSQVESSVCEMCGIAVSELKSGMKYGKIPTAKQLIIRILIELKYKPDVIIENLPYTGPYNTFRSRQYASYKFEKFDPKYCRVLKQLQETYL